MFDPLIWNGSRDLVAWNLMHRVEADAASKLTGAPLVAALMKAQSQLEELPSGKRVYWARVLHDQLDGRPDGRLRDEPVAQAILHNLLNELYNTRDTKFTNLATQQNKVTWLVLIGLAIMAALVSQGYQDLLLAGAVGGILSRLQRELQRRDVPSDYGLSWSVLFLSPVSGALSAWAGVLLLQTLQKFNVIDLAQLLPDNTDLTAPTGALLGVAILFGISERILDRLVRQAEDEISTKPQAAKKSATAAQEPPTHPAAAPEVAAPYGCAAARGVRIFPVVHFGGGSPVRSTRSVAAVVLSLLVVAVAPAVASGADWVGLGDSFAAGPLIPNQSLSPLGCLRSDRNFARLAAASRGMIARRCLLQRRQDDEHGRLAEHERGHEPAAAQRADGVDAGRVAADRRQRHRLHRDPPELRDLQPVRAAVPEPLQRGRQRSDQGPDRRGRAEGRHGHRGPSARVAACAHPRRQLRGDPARHRQRLLAAGAAGLHRRARTCARKQKAAQHDARSSRPRRHGAVYVDDYTASIGRDACRSSGTRWVEPLVPGNAAAPFHPNARGDGGHRSGGRGGGRLSLDAAARTSVWACSRRPRPSARTPGRPRADAAEVRGPAVDGSPAADQPGAGADAVPTTSPAPRSAPARGPSTPSRTDHSRVGARARRARGRVALVWLYRSRRTSLDALSRGVLGEHRRRLVHGASVVAADPTGCGTGRARPSMQPTRSSSRAAIQLTFRR